MSFQSPIYGLFLLALWIIYWLARSPKLQLWILLIASLVFYASLQLQYIPLMLVVTLINFRLGRALGANTSLGQKAKNPQISNQAWQQSLAIWNRRRSQILGMGIFLNVLLLVGFKYIPFLLNSLAAPLNLIIRTFQEIGISLSWIDGTASLLKISINENGNWIGDRLIVPLGLSFFVFECIAYLIDVYRGAPPAKKFLEFTTYKLFFPKLISGPITRYHYFAQELNNLHFPTSDRLAEGLWLIACGAVKKAFLADSLGIFVNLCLSNLERASSGDLWLAIFAFGLQLYLDFSGYVDIARGSAILLGFNLPENFDSPYFSTSIADFWRRWHITLGDWLRNYLYFPLGGSRQGLPRTCLNLLLIMLIAGLWHGAAWGYVIWGGLHGIALAIHRLTEALSQQVRWLKSWWQSWLGVLIAWGLTQSMVFVTWIFFRLPNLKQANLAIQHLWGYNGDIQFAKKVYEQALGLGRPQVSLLIVGLAGLMGIVYTFRQGLKVQLNWPIKLLLVPLCLFAVWLLAPEGSLPYIYFDF